MDIKLTKPPALSDKKDFNVFNTWMNTLFEWSNEFSQTFGNESKYLLRNGARTLLGNWDAGDVDIRSKTFTSDVATGTASPFNVSSTDLVTNLNAEHWNSKHLGTVNNGTLLRYNSTGTQIESGTITESSGALGAITTLSMSGQLTNTLAIGTSPFAITSTTVNTNLNSDMVDGKHVGTSGNTIPLLDGSNTWSANQTFGTNIKLLFRDADISISSSADGYMDYASDGRMNFTTPLFNYTYGTLPAAQLYGSYHDLTFNTPNPVSQRTGIYYNFTTAGSAAGRQVGEYFAMLPGYTGSAGVFGLYFSVSSASTGNNLDSWAGNFGFVNYVFGTTTGLNIGGAGYVSGGNLNIGLAGLAPVNKNSATNLGIIGLGLNGGTSPVQIGGYFALRAASAPNIPTVSGAIIGDNGTSTDDILRLLDNGTLVFQVKDAGTVYSKDFYPFANDTYYLGKNSISTPYAWKGVCVKDTTNGNYYRIEVISGTITATQIV